MPLKIQSSTFEPGHRILVTSDIHGHCELLRKLLAKSAYIPDDYLVIVGDIIEKGPQSLDTLRLIMSLCHDSDKVIPVMGNVDLWRIEMINGLDADSAESFYKYLLRMRKWRGTSLYDEMAAELNIPLNSADEVLASKPQITEHFSEALEFLASLPQILQTQRYVFVHGGLPSSDIPSLAGRNPFDVMKLDSFMTAARDSGTRFDKYVISGHWPVTLYNDHIAQANPVFDNESKIIAIDGGCGLKRDGQLNMLIIPDIGCDVSEITHVYADPLPCITALEAQKASCDSINIHWGYNKIRIIERGEHFTLCEHIPSGHRIRIFNPFIYKSDGDFGEVEDFTDYSLEIAPGDALSLVCLTPEGCVVKKNGVTGWYRGRYEYNE